MGQGLKYSRLHDMRPGFLFMYLVGPCIFDCRSAGRISFLANGGQLGKLFAQDADAYSRINALATLFSVSPCTITENRRIQ